MDGLRRDHLRGPSPGEDPAGAHHHDAVRVTAGLVEIVQDGHDRGAQDLIELPAQLEDLHLMRQVEVGRRLVEQQDPRLLGQGHRDPDPLTLASGQLRDPPARQLRHVRALHRRAHLPVVLLGPLVEHALVRIASPADELVHGDRLGGYGRLRQESDLTREDLGAHRGDLASVEKDRPRTWRQHLAQGAQEGRLPARVRADDHREGALVDRDVQAGHHILAGRVPQVQVVALQGETSGILRPRDGHHGVLARTHADSAEVSVSITTRAAVGPALRKNGSWSTSTARPADTADRDGHSFSPVRPAASPLWTP